MTATVTATTETVRSDLSDFDRDVLAVVPRAPEGWGMSSRSEKTAWYADPKPTSREIAAEWTGALLDSPSAVIVYKSRHSERVEFGVARYCYPAGYAGRTENQYEVSPFPGAWEYVNESQILAVRHTHAI